MDPADGAFFDEMMTVVARYGMKRATMTDIARALRVSRQTLYDRFGDKDELMAAMIDHMAQGLIREIQAAFAAQSDLGAKLDAYFQITVWPFYDMLQNMPDAADLEKGMGPASVAASLRAAEHKRVLLGDMLRHELPPHAHTHESVAAFIEHSASRAKMSDISRAELESYLAVLKASIIALASRA